MINVDETLIIWFSFVQSTLALAAVVGYGVSRLVDRPKPDHGREITSVDALFRGSEVPAEQLPVVHPRPAHYQGNRRRSPSGRVVDMAGSQHHR